MNIDVKFEELSQEFKADFGEVVKASDGGYEKGYEQGYARGHAEGNEKSMGLVSGAIAEYDSDEVTSVRQYAFYGCRNLKSVSLPAATQIGVSAFDYCVGLETLDLPLVTELPANSVSSCESLATVVFPSVKTIKNRAFYYSYAKAVDFPVLELIRESQAFAGSRIESLILRANLVVEVENSNCFYNSYLAKGTGCVYVPDNLVDSYRAAANWSTYAAQIKPLSEYVE